VSEGAPQRLHALLQLLGRRLGDRGALLLLGQPLVLQGQDQRVGDRPHDLAIGLVVPARPALGEEHAANHLFAEHQGGQEDRADPGLEDLAIDHALRVELVLGVADQYHLALAHARQNGRLVDGKRLRRHGTTAYDRGEPLELLPRCPEAAHAEQVEVERRPHGFTQAREDVADPKARAKDGRQGRDRLQTLAAPPLHLQQHHVLDEGADQIGDLAGGRDVLVREAARGAARQKEGAHDAPARIERHAEPGLEAGRLRPLAPPGRIDRPRQAGAVGDELRLAVEDRPERRRLARKPLARVEGDRVVVEVEGDIGPVDVAREGAERAPLVLEPGDEHAVVRHQRLRARGKLLQKALRVERAFEGARERRHAREEIRCSRAHSPPIVSHTSARYSRADQTAVVPS